MSNLMHVFILVLLLLATSTFAQNSTDTVPDYKPVTGQQRLNWFARSTAGPTSLLLAGPLSAAFGTALDRPHEYGPHWEGFGKRYGMRLTGIATGNAIEAGLGSLWGEDPRYFHSRNHVFGQRVKYVMKTTFMAPNRDGRWQLAYARYAGNVGNNFLSNTWRSRDENGPDDAALRCVWGVTGKMASNAFMEFWPDVKKLVFRKK